MNIDLLDETCIFSLTYRCSILISGTFWENVGAYYLFTKLNKKDDNFTYLRHRILVENSININKDIIGHKRRMDWDNVRRHVMHVALFNKFSQVEEYKRDLLNLFKKTNDSDIVVTNFSNYWIKSGDNNYVKLLRNIHDILNF